MCSSVKPRRALDPRLTRCSRAALVAAALQIFPPHALGADIVHDEIQVYNADIAEVGQWTVEQHLNYAWAGQTQPEFPGGFVSNHALQGTPEFAYGVANWWEFGFYLPFGVNGYSGGYSSNGSGEFLSDGVKVRNLFVVPDAANRSFFYGLNFELSYELPKFSLTRWTSGGPADHRSPKC